MQVSVDLPLKGRKITIKVAGKTEIARVLKNRAKVKEAITVMVNP